MKSNAALVVAVLLTGTVAFFGGALVAGIFPGGNPNTVPELVASDPGHVRIIWERWSVMVGVLQTVALVVTFCVMIFASIRQLRAYVAVTVNFMHSFDAATCPCAGYRIENRGSTPARDVSTNARLQAVDWPLPAGFLFPEVDNDPQPKTALFPGTGVDGQTVASQPFSLSEIVGIASGAKRIYIYGVTRYKDMFGFSRSTSFGTSVVADSATLSSLVTRYAARDLELVFEHVSELNQVT
ncbi:MAG TPA: hypothetical protein VGI90_09840 [Steroidobacteraceae bacterium]|jgi:hypothetical protein